MLRKKMMPLLFLLLLLFTDFKPQEATTMISTESRDKIDTEIAGIDDDPIDAEVYIATREEFLPEEPPLVAPGPEEDLRENDEPYYDEARQELARDIDSVKAYMQKVAEGLVGDGVVVVRARKRSHEESPEGNKAFWELAKEQPEAGDFKRAETEKDQALNDSPSSDIAVLSKKELPTDRSESASSAGQSATEKSASGSSAEKTTALRNQAISADQNEIRCI